MNPQDTDNLSPANGIVRQYTIEAEPYYRAVDDEGMYAFFDSLGIPRRARDDHVVDGFGWCSDDMVSFEATLRQGGFAVISDDVQRLTGRAPESVRDFMLRHKDQILAAASAHA